MLIKKHKTVASLAAGLMSQPGWQWLRAIPADVLHSLIGPVAKVAEWIVTERQELLTGSELFLAVAGSPLDSFESGAMWSTLAAMLGKQPGWVTGSIQVNGGKPLGTLGRMSIAPEFASSRIGVAQVPEDIAGLARLVTPRTSLIVSTVGSPLVPACVLCSGRAQVDEFFARGGSLVSLAQCEQDAVVMGGGASAMRMAHGVARSQFTDEGVEAGFGWTYWQFGPVMRPVAEERAKSYAEFSAELVDALESMRSPLAEDAEDSVEDDVVGWGVRGLLQSSVDSQDVYITLPRSVALRARTKTIVRLERSLAVDELAIRVDPEALIAYDALGDTWIERAGWAASLWNSGLGKVIDGTLMGRLQKMGMDVGASAFGDSVKAMMAGSGMDENLIKQFTDALTGGEPYAPRKGERRVHDLVKRGELAQAWAVIEAEPELANALNERREPLITVIALRGTERDVRRLRALGADINARDGGGRTVLTDVAASGSIGCVHALVDLGAGVNEADPIRWTPLLMAVKRGRWDVAGLLVDRGADVNWVGADGVSALGFVQGDVGRLAELDRMTEVLDNLHAEMGLPRMQEALKRKGLMADPSAAPAWLVSKMLAAA